MSPPCSPARSPHWHHFCYIYCSVQSPPCSHVCPPLPSQLSYNMTAHAHPTAAARQVEGWLASAVEIARSPGKSRDVAAVVEVRCCCCCCRCCYPCCCYPCCTRQANPVLGSPKNHTHSTAQHNTLPACCCLQHVGHILDYARKLARLAGEDDLVPGLGTPSIHGGPWDVEARRRDVREVYKIYTGACCAQ